MTFHDVIFISYCLKICPVKNKNCGTPNVTHTDHTATSYHAFSLLKLIKIVSKYRQNTVGVTKDYVILGFHSGLNEIFALLGCYAD